MTVFSLLRPGGSYVQRAFFALGRLGQATNVDRLAVIHFVRLAVIGEFPDHGQPQDYLRQTLQLFESNYNGSFGSYIDMFVQALPGRMRALWGTSYGFPWRLPLGPFKHYILQNEFPIDHYYVRNPEVTVKMVKSALRIVQATAELRQDAHDLDPDEFAERLRALVTHLQSDL
ncbi:MAG: hypothetical protein JO286_05255 [Solirubrobacterales bacterium]|nr:hypothetical protein [Solirubrobacterales bacterium]MBV9362809.1 hypothetical protein [Solirubrobacterales bacterium]MBV9806569.1 hypothetical protein [Solirubrobacterales bacterium]